MQTFGTFVLFHLKNEEKPFSSFQFNYYDIDYYSVNLIKWTHEWI